jgi:hypothetical protein
MKVLSRESWLKALDAQAQRVQTLLQGNGLQQKNHPIYNFISSYYHFKPEILFQFSPDLETTLMFNDESDLVHLSKRGRSMCVDRIHFDPTNMQFSSKQIEAFRKTHRILLSVHNRPPTLNCFGFHEWAMLYSEASSVDLKQDLPLRVSRESIRDVLMTNKLRCSHYDAFRFFTKDSMPLNTVNVNLSRMNQEISEQPGCVHVHMDMFKWSFKIFPFISSELLTDTLSLSLQARSLDMRASPYDLKACSNLGAMFNPEPILVETPSGRRDYQKYQMELYAKSKPIREKLISAYSLFLSKILN